MANIDLIIRIPDDYIKYIDIDEKGSLFDMALTNAIKNGTPLPKGHGRLIDADYLREDFKNSKKISFAERMDISCIVDHAPTILEADNAESEEED